MTTTIKTTLLSLLLVTGAVALHSTPAGAAGKYMSSKDLVHTVSEQIKAGLPSQLLLEGVRLPKGFTVPRGAVVEIKWRGTPREGNVWVLVSASIDEKVARRGFARVELVAIRQVLVAQRAMTKGDVVLAEDLALQPRVGAKGVQLSAAALIGSPVLADLAEGDVISGSSVGLPAPISRGTSIMVVSQAGAVRITAQARLEATARPGESARARIIATRQLVRGQLVDEHTLMVDMGDGQ